MADLRDDFKQALEKLQKAAVQAQGRPGAQRKLRELQETREKLRAQLARIQDTLGPQDLGPAQAWPPFESRLDNELRALRQAVVPLMETVSKVNGRSHLEEARIRFQKEVAPTVQPRRRARVLSEDEKAMGRLNDLHRQLGEALGFLVETLDEVGPELGLDNVHALVSAEAEDLGAGPVRLDARDQARIDGALRSLSSELGVAHDPEAPHSPEVPSLLGRQERVSLPKDKPHTHKRKRSAPASVTETLQRAMKGRVVEARQGSWGAFGSGSSEESVLPSSGDTTSSGSNSDAD